MQRRPAPNATKMSRELHVPFVLTALAFAILGGFSLAIVLPVEAALGIGTASRVSHAQIHGHMQVVGFVGVMMVGIAYHLIPAFEGRSLAAARLTTPSLVLLAGGVLLRVIGQPLATHSTFAATMVLGAIMEAAGSACFAVVVLATLRPGLRRGDPTPWFFCAGAVWFATQAMLGAWWVTDAALAGSPALPPVHDELLVTLQLFGFVLFFILGVGVRAFPVFFAVSRPGMRALAVPYALCQIGVACALLATLLRVTTSVEASTLAGFGSVSLGIGLFWVTARTGWWRAPSRLRPASMPFALPLQIALAWLSTAALALVGMGITGLFTQSLPPASQVDAVRHIVAVGVVLTTIVAMGQLVLPEFASERFSGAQSAWRRIALGVLLAVATVLRAGSRWWDQSLPPLGVNIAMAAGGVIGMAVMATFAVLYVRGLRQHRALLARFAAMTEGGGSWALTPVTPRPSDPEP